MINIDLNDELLESWMSWGSLEEACREVGELLSGRFSDYTDTHGNVWRGNCLALCCRRDVKALLQPHSVHSLHDLQKHLRIYRDFDNFPQQTLSTTDKKLKCFAERLPPNKIYGACEGGMPAEEITDRNGDESVQRVIAGFSVRGGFGKQGALDVNESSIFLLYQFLHTKRVALAAVSETRLPPGVIWPARTGYTFVGERCTGPESAGAWVPNEAVEVIVQISDVGDQQALWFELPSSDIGAGDSAASYLCLLE